MPVRHNRLINSIASHVFAVYLVHCQPLMINFIWLRLVKANQFETTPYVFVYVFVVKHSTYTEEDPTVILIKVD